MLTVGLGLAVLVMVGGLLVLLRRSAHQRAPDDRDQDVLEEAEREVRDLRASASPDEADDELRDWGPGTPR